MSVFVI